MPRSLNRREFIRLAGLIAASTGVAGCASVYDRLAPAPGSWTPWPIAGSSTFSHLNRMTYGPRSEERAAADDAGIEAWIEEQLAPESLDDPSADLRLRRFTTLDLPSDVLADLSDRIFDNVDRFTVPDQLRQATLIRQVYSRRQLLEVMVEFWTDHFNISVEKGDCFFLKTVDDREVIRRHALGNFGELLWASAHSPAMLVYLDNQSNRKGSPNENYARELMELHSLGVSGGYTQADVMELARCLTGWTVKEHFWRGEFTFNSQFHDAGPKRVLGEAIDPLGQIEAERVLDVLSIHPSTAHFIAAKLARRFIAEDPPPGLVDLVAGVFKQTNGDIRSVLRALLMNGLEFVQPKFKRPSHFVVSALRILNARTDGGEAIQRYLKRMGQPYFAWPTPDGYPDRSEAWSGNLLPRWQFAYDLAHGALSHTTVDLPGLVQAAGPGDPASLVDRMSTLLLGQPLPPTTKRALLDSVERAGAIDDEGTPSLLLAAILASPAFQWR